MHDDDDDWDEDSGDDGYVPCPYCGESMYEESGYCSACDRWISREDAPQRTLAPWMVMTIVGLVAIMILSALCLI